MLIVEHASLVEVDGLFTFREELFSGVSLQTEDGIVSHKRHYASGCYQGTYVNPIFPDSMNQMHILSSAFDFPVDFEYDHNEAYMFQGKHYHGWAYFFQDQVCRKEQFISLGYGGSECIYYPDGRIKEIGIYESPFEQNVTWNVGGGIKGFKISDDGDFGFKCLHDEYGNLTSLGVGDQYFRMLDCEKYQRIRNPYRDFSFLESERVDVYLVLRGTGINDDVIRLVTRVSGFKSLKRLSISSVCVSPVSLKDLALILELEELSLNKINGVDFELALEIKKLIPRCRVLFEGRHVLL